MSDPTQLQYLTARRNADRRAILRLVPAGDAIDHLPDAEAVTGRGVSLRGRILRPIGLVILSVAGVWFVTVGAWDDEGFFPWFWNVVWLFFPWVFLGPLWAAYVRGVRRDARDRALRASWADASRVPSTAGAVEAVHCQRSDTGGILGAAVTVRDTTGTVTIDRLAPGSASTPAQLPAVGDPVRVWRLDGGRIVVQAERGRD